MLPAKNRNQHLALISQTRSELKNIDSDIREIDIKIQNIENYVQALTGDPNGSPVNGEKLQKGISALMETFKNLKMERESLKQRQSEMQERLSHYFPGSGD